MKPREKAGALVQKYAIQFNPEHKGRIDEGSGVKIFEYNIELAKQCAFIAVDELILNCSHLEMYYWNQVKQEINEL